MKKYRLVKTDLAIIEIAKKWGLKAHICNEHGAFSNQNGSNKCPTCGKECPEYKDNK